MAGEGEGREKKKQTPEKYSVDAKWNACLDLSLRRVVYSSLAGTLGALLLFRTPATRWASVALGAGVGIGSAYTECSYIFDGPSPKTPVVKDSAVPSGSSQEEKD